MVIIYLDLKVDVRMMVQCGVGELEDLSSMRGCFHGEGALNRAAGNKESL